jgi:hypothetical protein
MLNAKMIVALPSQSSSKIKREKEIEMKKQRKTDRRESKER